MKTGDDAFDEAFAEWWRRYTKRMSDGFAKISRDLREREAQAYTAAEQIRNAETAERLTREDCAKVYDACFGVVVAPDTRVQGPK